MKLLEKDLDAWELEQLLSGKYDNCGCRLTIMAGAGGTEAQDWALMLQRMYIRFFQRRGFKYKMVEEEVNCTSLALADRDDGEGELGVSSDFEAAVVQFSLTYYHFSEGSYQMICCTLSEIVRDDGRQENRYSFISPKNLA